MPGHFVYSGSQKVSTLIKKPRLKSLTNLAIELLLPYRIWLIIIFMAMMFETAMSLAAPWPLKIVIDNVIGAKPLPHWLSWMNTLLPDGHIMSVAGVCAIALVLITFIDGLAGYIDNYFTESVAQYMAND